jgi:hypothetical protein
LTIRAQIYLRSVNRRIASRISMIHLRVAGFGALIAPAVGYHKLRLLASFLFAGNTTAE